MLTIPYLDKLGKPLALRFRCIEDHKHVGHGKYMSLPGEPSRTYNVKAIHEATDTIEIAEGEFDALTLERIGLHAIAIPGVSAWGTHHRKLLAGFATVRMWADVDANGAGDTLATAVARSIRHAKIVRLPFGDVNEVYRKLGAEALLSLIGEK